MVFRKYLTSKCQGWFRRWGHYELAAAPAAAPAPGDGRAEAQAVLDCCSCSARPAVQAHPVVSTVLDDNEDAELTGAQEET